MKYRLPVLTLVVIIAALAAGVVFLARQAQPPETDTDTPIVVQPHPLIRVANPKPGEVVTSPLAITGEAKGFWFFEANFPIFLTDWDGLIIAQHYAEAIGEWMTTEFVPFRAVLEFTPPFGEGEDVPEFMTRGTLILGKSNASGLPEHDDAIEIPVRFR